MSVLSRFDTIRLRTECGFARGAQLWGSDDWPAGGFDAAINSFGALLVRLGHVPGADQPDGAVFEFPDPRAGRTVDALARTTQRVVAALCAIDPGPAPEPAVPVDDPRWLLHFAGAPFYVVTFGPCYGPDSSRHAFGLTSSYLLFQTRASFVKRWGRGLSRLPDRSRTEIRQAFSEAGRPYDLSITLCPLEANRFVKPRRFGDPAVQWWAGQGT